MAINNVKLKEYPTTPTKYIYDRYKNSNYSVDYDYPSEDDLKWNPEYLGTGYATKQKSELELLTDKYNNLVKKVQEVRLKAKKDVVTLFYEEELAEMRLNARSEVFANLAEELREQFLSSEAADDIYLEVRAGITAEVREEIRQEILADMQKAKDRV